MSGDESEKESFGYYGDNIEAGAVVTGIDPLPMIDDGFGQGAGISIFRHPVFLLRDTPEIAVPFKLFQTGADKIDHALWASLSHYELECLEALISAYQRKEMRKIKEQENKQNGQTSKD